MRVALVLGVLVLGACGSFDAAKEASTTPDGGGEGDGGGGGDGDAGTTSDTGTTTPPKDASGPDLSLLGHWKLDETDDELTARNEVGKHHAQRVNGAWAAGKIGGAFAATNGYLAVQASPDLVISNELTIAAWVNFDEKLQSVGDSYILTHGTTLYAKLNNRKPQLTIGTDDYKIQNTIPLSTWHHLAFTFASGVPKIYVDGELGATDTNTMTVSTRPDEGAGPLYFGAYAPTSGNPIGLVDDVRVWKRALTAAEVSDLVK